MLLAEQLLGVVQVLHRSLVLGPQDAREMVRYANIPKDVAEKDAGVMDQKDEDADGVSYGDTSHSTDDGHFLKVGHVNN